MNIHEILSFVDQDSIITAHSLLNHESAMRFCLVFMHGTVVVPITH